jgi:type I restriction enzyme S subunit
MSELKSVDGLFEGRHFGREVIISRDRATRGRPCFVDTDREFGYFVSVALIKPFRYRLYGQYLVYFLNSNWIKDRMADKSRGYMIPHIVLREIRAFPVPTPPLAEQRRIVNELNALQAKMVALKNLQAETAAELGALLPAVLDRAFNGGL